MISVIIDQKDTGFFFKKNKKFVCFRKMLADYSIIYKIYKIKQNKMIFIKIKISFESFYSQLKH